jgi:hypothetical protein
LTDKAIVNLIKEAFPPLSIKVARARELNMDDLLAFVKEKSFVVLPKELNPAPPPTKKKKKKASAKDEL